MFEEIKAVMKKIIANVELMFAMLLDDIFGGSDDDQWPGGAV
jgi:hypothetical protein